MFNTYLVQIHICPSTIYLQGFVTTQEGIQFLDRTVDLSVLIN
jgi:hypothetical protein